MFKKSIISLLSLLTVLSHAGQVHATKKLSPAAQAFFQRGNHDDVKLHMFGYLLDDENLSSLTEDEGNFFENLKTFVNLKDKTFQEGLERLCSPIKKDGRQTVDLKKIKIRCAQEAVMSGNQTMLEIFLPEIFVEKPKEHVLFPQDLTSDEAKDLLKQTSLLDLACRYHETPTIGDAIYSKFFPNDDLTQDQFDQYTPVYVVHGRKTDMQIAIDTNDKERIKTLLKKKKDLDERFIVFERIIAGMSQDTPEDLCSFLEEMFPQEKAAFDNQLLWNKSTWFVIVKTWKLLKPFLKIRITIPLLYYYLTITYKLFTLFGGIKGIILLSVVQLFCLFVGTYKALKLGNPAETRLNLILQSFGITALRIPLELYGLIIVKYSVICILDLGLVSPALKIFDNCVCKPIKGICGLITSPWQKIKNAIDVVRNRRQYTSLFVTKQLQEVC